MGNTNLCRNSQINAVALDRAEKRKLLTHRGSSVRVTPFVVESNGRSSHSTRRWIAGMCKNTETETLAYTYETVAARLQAAYGDAYWKHVGASLNIVVTK